MNVDVGMILASTINFVIFYFILKKLVFDKTIAVIDARQKEVQESMDRVEAGELKVEALKKQYDLDTQKYKEDGIKLVEQYKAKADNVYRETIEESKKDIEGIKESAMKEIEREKAKASNEVRAQVIDLSMKIAEKVLEKEIDENNHRELIDDFIAKVGN